MQKHNVPFVFFGTPRFAAIVLSTLLEHGLSPATIVTNPDRPVGRKKIITPPPTKILAQKSNIPILQPESLSHSKFEIQNSKFTLGVLAAYGKIVPKEVIELFPKGIIGIHPSLLPKYRGATPIQNALLEGDAKTGVTLFLTDEQVDHGKIISNAELLISNEDTYLTLEEKLAKLGAELLAQTLPGYLDGTIVPKEQEHAEATFTKKFSTDDAFVPIQDLEAALEGEKEKAVRIDRMVRALNPEPGAWTLQNGKRMKLLGSRITEDKLLLTKIQLEGKKPQEL